MLGKELRNRQVGMIVLVAALGYFVDIYDLVLFGMERVRSLTEIFTQQYPFLKSEIFKPALDKAVTDVGLALFNWQMIGMLLGGIFWGVIGDKKGRLSVLFGSILLYSLANIANGMVHSVNLYAVLRFISGFGLAGELGAGITLVSESMSKENRGWGAMIVASVGLSGAVAAGLVGQFFGNWRLSYFIGGGMGLALLLLRIGVFESGMFSSLKESTVKRGDFFALFRTRKNLGKFLNIILIALPVWFVMGILIQLCKELGQAFAFGKGHIPDPRMAITIAYAGITVGDVISGWLSQRMKSRKKALRLFLLLTLGFSIIYFCFGLAWKHRLFGMESPLPLFYTIVVFIGFATGYWAVFMVAASELFGTNMRATVTTTAPNFVRGGAVLLTTGFQFFGKTLHFDSILSAAIIGVMTFILAFIALKRLEETYHKDLNYVELP